MRKKNKKDLLKENLFLKLDKLLNNRFMQKVKKGENPSKEDTLEVSEIIKKMKILILLILSLPIFSDDRFTKPQHWMYCWQEYKSNIPPVIIRDMLAKFPLSYFPSSEACEDAIFINNRIVSSFGIECKCKYRVITRKQADELNGR